MPNQDIRKEFTFSRRQALGWSLMGLTVLTLGSGCAKTPTKTLEDDEPLEVKGKRKYRSLEEIYKNAPCSDERMCDQRLIPVLTMDDNDNPVIDQKTGSTMIEGYITPKCRLNKGGDLQHRFILSRYRVPADKIGSIEPIIIKTQTGESVLAFTNLEEAMAFRKKLDTSEQIAQKAIEKIQQENQKPNARLAMSTTQLEVLSNKLTKASPFGSISRENISSFLKGKTQPATKATPK